LDDKDHPTVLFYMAPDRPEKHCGYGIASVIFSAVMIPLVIVLGDLGFYGANEDQYKWERVGLLSGIAGILMAGAGYQQPNRKRLFAHIGLVLGILGFLRPILMRPM
jgi:hypothetical protein